MLLKAPVQAITYRSMIWLLVAQLTVMLPFMFYLPFWLIPVMLFSAWWRLRVIQGHASQPTLVIILLMIGLGIGGLALSGLPLVSLDMMASFLLLGFAYKSIEVLTPRDALVVIFTGYLLIAIQFLYSQSMLIAAYGVVSLIVLTAALISLQTQGLGNDIERAILPNLRLSAVMLILCLPLMITLFFFMPRISPLWTLSLSSGDMAKTGITDQMTPGDIAELSQSDDLAFRVTFDDKKPAQKQLYWRGIILSYFSGKSWQQFEKQYDQESLKHKITISNTDLLNHMEGESDVIEYEVIYEQSGQPWLFTLAPVLKIRGDAVFGSDYRVMANKDLTEPFILHVSSALDIQLDVGTLSTSVHRANLQLPESGDQKSRVYAKRIHSLANSDEDYINKVLQNYRQQAFVYTLRPERIGNTDTIDTFLFETQRGFCAHYAGSFVFLMRAAGIPARVVVGYQGGEWNEQSNYLAVRQYDAHAWTEVWLKNKGWVRYDPTAMVAPDRVERSLESAVEEEGSFLENKAFSPVKIKWLSGLRKKIDSLQYGWRRLVLGYDENSQSVLFEKLFGGKSLLQNVLLVGGILVAIFTLWSFILRLGRRRSREVIEHRLYRKFCMQMELMGVQRKVHQSPNDFALVAASKLPELTSEIKDLTRLYQKLCYECEEGAKKKNWVRELRVLVKRIKWLVLKIRVRLFISSYRFISE